MIENLQRQEIDPVDKARAILAFFQARHSGMDLDGVASALLNDDRDPQRVKDEITATVAVISNDAGIKTRTIENLLSLLKLPPKIDDTAKAVLLPASQGYLLAADLENLRLLFVSLIEIIERVEAVGGTAKPGEPSSNLRQLPQGTGHHRRWPHIALTCPPGPLILLYRYKDV